MRILAAATGGFLLDLLLGDPGWLTPVHPVVLIGKAISLLEKVLRARFPKTLRGERQAGFLLVLLITAGTWLFCRGILLGLDRLSTPAAFVLELLWCWQALAIRDLCFEAGKVRRKLEEEDLNGARNAVARIVGRDTEALSEAGVARAAVETVAENFADGIVAPLFYMLLGGAPLAMSCKAVNTMDSMLGYRNERYLNFGRAAAKLDDAVNLLPSRIGALLLIAAAGLARADAANALRIWKRDRYKHVSPNSGQCEAAMAGALGVRLCGPASYFGIYTEKPWIGEAGREITPEDIRRACRLDVVGSILGMLIFSFLRWLVII